MIWILIPGSLIKSYPKFGGGDISGMLPIEFIVNESVIERLPLDRYGDETPKA
ncbi:MAG: hypothetical protein HKL80_02260 [Acidimicrobiales bacterium]|nr:hypothetical protein [Acidimicrobiales bacterium]